MIARSSIRALSCNADRRFFARRDREIEPRRRRSVASTTGLATRFGRSADETPSTHVTADLRRCPRCLPRPGPRLQGASPAAKTISRRVGENTRFRNVFRDARDPRGNARGRAGATAFPPRDEAAASVERALHGDPSRAARSARPDRSNARTRRPDAAGGGHVGRAAANGREASSVDCFLGVLILRASRFAPRLRTRRGG